MKDVNYEMDKDHFLKIMSLIDGAYPTFKLTDNTIKSYYYFLKNYKGYLLTDAYPGYAKVNNVINCFV